MGNRRILLSTNGTKLFDCCARFLFSLNKCHMKQSIPLWFYSNANGTLAIPSNKYCIIKCRFLFLHIDRLKQMKKKVCTLLLCCFHFFFLLSFGILEKIIWNFHWKRFFYFSIHNILILQITHSFLFVWCLSRCLSKRLFVYNLWGSTPFARFIGIQLHRIDLPNVRE